MSRLGWLAISACAMLLAGAPATAQQANDEWEFSLTPYLWLPTIGGDLKYEVPPGSGIGAPTVTVGTVNWVELLNYGLLVAGNAQKGRLSLFGDLVFVSMTSENDGRVVSIDDSVTVPVNAALNVDTQTDLDGLALTMTAGYVFVDEEERSATVFAANSGWTIALGPFRTTLTTGPAIPTKPGTYTRDLLANSGLATCCWPIGTWNTIKVPTS